MHRRTHGFFTVLRPYHNTIPLLSFSNPLDSTVPFPIPTLTNIKCLADINLPLVVKCPSTGPRAASLGNVSYAVELYALLGAVGMHCEVREEGWEVVACEWAQGGKGGAHYGCADFDDGPVEGGYSGVYRVELVSRRGNQEKC
jgi:hypothetical protein